jgi:hypothetical protein
MKPVDIQEGILHSDSGLTTRLVVAVFLFFLFPHIVCFSYCHFNAHIKVFGSGSGWHGQRAKRERGQLGFRSDRVGHSDWAFVGIWECLLAALAAAEGMLLDGGQQV